jgi:mutator protein MutT
MDNYKQYFVACAVIFRKDGKILLTKRNHPSNNEVHNKWQFPGGSVDSGEHPIESAVREVREETGLTVNISATRPFIFSHTFNDGTHVILIVYKAQYVSGNLDISHDLDETSDAQWFTPDEIKHLDSLPETNEIIAAVIATD